MSHTPAEHPQRRSGLVFLATMLMGGSLLLTDSVDQGVFRSFTLFITRLSEAALNLIGFDIIRSVHILRASDGSFAMGVGNNCNGTWAHLIFLASVLAYPATWRQRLVGLVAGESLLLFLNIFRIGSLFAIGVYAPCLFEAAHVYVWQFLIIGFAILLFFVWVDRIVAPSP